MAKPMIPRDRNQAYERAPLGELFGVLLRQFKRPLAAQGIPLTDGEAVALGEQIAARSAPPERLEPLRDALRALVDESAGVLARWNLTFAQSLETEMSDISGWETTAEFLAIANEKANAELRIATGAALLVALGDMTYAPVLLHLVERERTAGSDLDTVIARRLLLSASGINPNEPDWREQLAEWARSL